MSDPNHYAGPGEPTPPAAPHPEPRGGAWNHLIRRGVPIVILLVGLVGAWLYWGRADHAPAAQAGPAQLPAAPLPVQAIVVQPSNVALRPRFLGQTEASQIVEIRSRVRGFLLQRAFEEGQPVKKNQVLFQIDPKPFEADLEVARAAQVSAQARVERARQEVARYEQLFAQKNATANELDEIRTEARVAEAAVQQETARVTRAQLDLGYTTIRSPIDGATDRAHKDVGSYIDDSANSLLTVVRQVDPIYVRYSVSEQELLRWQRLEESGEVKVPRDVGQLELEVTLGDGRPYPHHGRINFVDVRVDPTTGTAVIRGSVPNPENTLRPGQFVHASVLGIERLNTIVVPQKAVVQSPSGATVYIVNDKNVVEQRPVTLGDWVQDGWVIENGLQSGERVVVDRLMQIRPGSPVTVAAASSATRPVAAAQK
jgi:membrane fusion protein (multidrug efflux system)